jgi:hypothetical protein
VALLVEANLVGRPPQPAVVYAWLCAAAISRESCLKWRLDKGA